MFRWLAHCGWPSICLAQAKLAPHPSLLHCLLRSLYPAWSCSGSVCTAAAWASSSRRRYMRCCRDLRRRRLGGGDRGCRADRPDDWHEAARAEAVPRADEVSRLVCLTACSGKRASSQRILHVFSSRTFCFNCLPLAFPYVFFPLCPPFLILRLCHCPLKGPPSIPNPFGATSAKRSGPALLVLRALEVFGIEGFSRLSQTKDAGFHYTVKKVIPGFRKRKNH